MITFIIAYIIGTYVGPIILIGLILWGLYALVTNLGSVVTGVVESLPWIIRWIFELAIWIIEALWGLATTIFWWFLSIFGVYPDNFFTSILKLFAAGAVLFTLFMIAGYRKYQSDLKKEEEAKRLQEANGTAPTVNNTPNPPTN